MGSFWGDKNVLDLHRSDSCTTPSMQSMSLMVNVTFFVFYYNKKISDVNKCIHVLILPPDLLVGEGWEVGCSSSGWSPTASLLPVTAIGKALTNPIIEMDSTLTKWIGPVKTIWTVHTHYRTWAPCVSFLVEVVRPDNKQHSPSGHFCRYHDRY